MIGASSLREREREKKTERNITRYYKNHTRVSHGTEYFSNNKNLNHILYIYIFFPSFFIPVFLYSSTEKKNKKRPVNKSF